MARRMTIRGNTDHSAIAEQIVLAIHLQNILTGAVVAREEVIAPHLLARLPSPPLTPLNYEPRVGKERVTAGVIEMEMRVHQAAYGSRIDPECIQPIGNLLASAELDVEDFSHRTVASSRVL